MYVFWKTYDLHIFISWFIKSHRISPKFCVKNQGYYDLVEISPLLVESVGEARLPEVVDFDGEFLLMHGT